MQESSCKRAHNDIGSFLVSALSIVPFYSDSCRMAQSRTEATGRPVRRPVGKYFVIIEHLRPKFEVRSIDFPGAHPSMHLYKEPAYLH